MPRPYLESGVGADIGTGCTADRWRHGNAEQFIGGLGIGGAANFSGTTTGAVAIFAASFGITGAFCICFASGRASGADFGRIGFFEQENATHLRGTFRSVAFGIAGCKAAVA